MPQPKIALFDIETAPSLGYFWGRMFETNIISVDTPWYMLCFSYRWYGERKIHTRSLREYVSYKKDKEDDRKLICDLHKVFDEADVLIGHNSNAFDIRKTNARFIKHGLKPPSPYKTVDTLKAARRHFLFESNKLNDLGQYLGVGKKLPNTGFDLWRRTMAGDDEAWDTMERYNRRDVVLLEKVYDKLKPYMTGHPKLDAFSDKSCCPVCQSRNTERRGIQVSLSRKYQRYQCMDCGHWHRGDIIPRKK